MLRGVDDEAGMVRAAATVELRVLANRRYLTRVLEDPLLFEPWRGPVVEPASRELVAVALERWAAETAEVPLSA